MKHFKEFMRSATCVAKEYIAKRDIPAVEKDFLTYFTVLSLDLVTISHESLHDLKGLKRVPLMDKIDKFMQSAKKLAEHI